MNIALNENNSCFSFVSFNLTTFFYLPLAQISLFVCNNTNAALHFMLLISNDTKQTKKE